MKYKVLGKQNNSSMCFVCGMSNTAGLRAKFYNCLSPAGEPVLLGIIKPLDEHQSYPNRMHGGVSAAILDEAVGRALWVTSPGIWGVTMELTTRYRRPVPLDVPLYIECKITKVTHRGFDGEGRIFTATEPACVTASARYMILPVEQISEEMINHENWFYVDEDLPEFIEIK